MTPIRRLVGASLLALATLLALAPAPAFGQETRLIAGEPLFIDDRGHCAIGAVVRTADGGGGFLTGYGCGEVGGTVRLANGQRGTVEWASRSDVVAFVRAHQDWILTPYAHRYGGGDDLTVRGSREAPVGDSVCRSGPTTGWHCGTIQAKNQSLYPVPWPVHGVTRTTICVEPGDHGGPVYSGDQLQGITIGGSGNCRTGGVTFFRPIEQILPKYDLTLVTG
ncbi:streptogrisin C [Nocardiopsis mwathae]|uniref:Streptogrisin C n=1 Tax=Nocardiopsis mwathae TaxID=1472723 RepID=A0A7W9YHW6_9ACTN|nr:S1 family peptidase [Nocardiopsis mwathae]MBB6171506.1 streptogrisin C [Nocardiopsis mwathae]